MLEAALGFLAGLVAAVPAFVLFRATRDELSTERDRVTSLIDRLSSRDYEHFAAVKTFVEPWNEDDLHRRQNPDGVTTVYDPSGLVEAESPAVP